MTFAVIGLLFAGLMLLVVGAEALVRGASKLAAILGISPLIIGLTVVAFGTSSPEMAVSIQSSFAGQPDIALGNVLGSNIFNVLFILGVSALASPLIVAQQLIRLDVPIMIGASLLLLLFALDGKINQSDGVILFIGILTYLGFLLYQGRKENQPDVQAEGASADTPASATATTWIVNLGLIVVGLLLLVQGSRWLVESAIAIARSMGVSELVIGLTIVAAGTALPELATSVLASIKGERDIAVGNIVGSNIFNILAVLGLSAAISPTGGVAVSDAALRFNIPVLIAVAIACLPIFFTGNLITRWEGFGFMAYYAVYATYLVLDSTQHASLPTFSNAIVFFILPITVLTIAIVTAREIQQRRTRRI